MIYLTQEGKEKLEARIAELEKWSKRNGEVGEYDAEGMMASELKEILSTAVILPEEKSWEDVELYPPDNESQDRKTLKLKNGVIINPNL